MVDNSLVIRNLGEGLILRRATPDDTDKLEAFNARVHSDMGWDNPDTHTGVWVRDLMLKPHPTFKPEDFLVVENTATGEIVSSSNLIVQTWSYGGIEIPVGRPELVGTHPDYRNRGLVRAQFAVLHQWSAERGHKMQAISGIPYYYRQFGYEMAVDMHGGYSGPLTSVLRLEDGITEPYQMRPATPADVPFIQEVEVYAVRRHLVRCVRDAALWRYEVEGRTPGGAGTMQVCVIASAEGAPVGYLVHPDVLWGDALSLWVYELQPGVSWWEVTPCVMRYLKAKGIAYRPYYDEDDAAPFARLIFLLGREHPCYPIVSQEWLTRFHKPYSWYMRVPDLPDFLRTIAPVLEERLARSVMVGYSGELWLNFYRDGLHLVFEKGCLTDVQPWESPANTETSTEFPPLTFLQLLFGYRSLAELIAAFPDCGGRLEARLLLDALFPKQVSYVWPVS
jgi:hypothetical protein